MLLLMLIYYAGISSCGIQGSEKAQHMLPNIKNLLISSFLASFGGGLIRDIFLLHTYPVVFTLNCTPAIVIALLSGIIYISMPNQKIIMWFSLFADAAGLGQFISIGVDKALNMGVNNIITFLCGVITALGGGVMSSLFCGILTQKALSKNIPYYFWTFLGTYLYIVLINYGIKQFTAQIVIVMYTSITIISCNQRIRSKIKKYVMKTISIILQSVVIYPSTKLWQMVIPILKVCHYSTLKRHQNIHQETVHIPFQYRQKILLLHRIRQM